MKDIILFELNEVPPWIVDYFVQRHPRSHLARHLDRFERHQTYTEDIGPLSPWKTWPSLHRGVANDKHLLHDFGQPLDEADRQYPPVWKILADKGIKCGVFGSLHSYPAPVDNHYSFYVPDVFAETPECFPSYLRPLQDITLRMTRASSRNVSRSIPLKEASALFLSLPRTGIRIRTMGAVFGQLASERIQRWKATRRRTYQAIVAFDAFSRQLRIQRPQFCTFFTNHVASAMHRYWAAAFPEDYSQAVYDEKWIRTYQGEIRFAMEKADDMLGILIRFVDKNPSYELIVASSMGQRAEINDPFETQLSLKSPERFFNALGIRTWVPRPAMFPQYNFVTSEDECTHADRMLQNVLINGKHLGYRRSESFFSIDLGHQNLKGITVEIMGRPMQAAECGLENIEIEDKSTSSAYHVPEGTLLIYNRRSKSGTGSVLSTLQIAPYVLKNFNIGSPTYMKESAF